MASRTKTRRVGLAPPIRPPRQRKRWGKPHPTDCNFDQHKLLPEADFGDFTPPEPSIPPSPGCHNEWIAACRGEGPATCYFDYSGPLAETVLLGNVAYRAGGFDWDPRTLTAKGNAKAAPLLKESYRSGWDVTL